MKKVIHTGVGIVTLSALMSAPALSYAQFNTGLTADVSGAVDSVIGTDIEAQVNSSTSLETDADVRGHGEESGSVRAEKRSENASADTRSTLRVNAAGIAVTSASQVQSEADLEVFTANLPAEEEGVAKVEIDSGEEGEIEVVYKLPGRLFGFIPITLKSTAIVEAHANSEVEVRAKMPWWAFLVAKDDYRLAELETKIETNPVVEANARANASAQAKAKVAEAIIAEVEAHVNAQAAVAE